MKFKAKDYVTALQNFVDGRKNLVDLEMEILGGENRMSPLSMLRHYEEDVTVDSLITIAQEMCINKTVVLYDKEVEVFRFDYTRGSIDECFYDKPYLLDPFLKLCYGVLVKKLTAPSSVSADDGATQDTK